VKPQGQGGERHSRAKDDRIEREIVSRHAAIGIKTEHYPLGGGTRFRGSSHAALLAKVRQ
jgi:hypothetical protein